MHLDYVQEPAKNPRLLGICLGLSLLLHVGLAGILGAVHFFTQNSEPLRVVNVQLFDIQHVSQQSTNSQDSPSQETMPSMKFVSRGKSQHVHASMRKSLSLSGMPLVSLQSGIPVNTETRRLPNTKERYISRPPLFDQMAQNALGAMDRVKVIPYASSSSKGHTPQSEQPQSLQPNLLTGVPGVTRPVQRKTAMGTFPRVSGPATTTRRVLSMNIPNGEEGIEKTGARLEQSTPPVYPRVAREEGWEGVVVVRVRLHKDGTPDNVSVKKTSGHDVLDQAALQAIYRWSFSPAKDGNIPIPSLVDIPVRFDLTNG